MEIKAIDKKIAVVLKECEELSSKAEIMNSVPGVGVATIAMLLSELPKPGGLNRMQDARWFVRFFIWLRWYRPSTTR